MRGIFSINKIISTLIRVNHAGELGAVYMYNGHLKIYKTFHMCEIAHIEAMLENEKEHMKYFISKIVSYSRPSIVNSIWRICSESIGLISTLLMQYQGTMSCIDGVETVVSKHYRGQLSQITIIIANQLALLKREKERSVNLPELEKVDALRYISFLQVNVALLEELKDNVSKFLEDEEIHRDSANAQYMTNKVTEVHRRFVMCLTKLAINISKRI